MAEFEARTSVRAFLRALHLELTGDHKSGPFLWQNSCSVRNQSVFTFRRSYFLATVLLLLTEALIALHVHDRIIRPYFGDFLAVVLVYCLVRKFFAVPVRLAALLALGAAYVLELLPLVHFLQRRGLQQMRLARVLLGSSFSWLDILLYTAGTGPCSGPSGTALISGDFRNPIPMERPRPRHQNIRKWRVLPWARR